MVLFNRAGPLGKPVDGYSPALTGAVRDCTLQGLCCRRRAVNGIPSAVNMAQLAAVKRLQLAAYAWPLRRHYGAADVADKLHRNYHHGWEVYSDDISAFDKSVAQTHQTEMDEEIYARVLGRQTVQMKQWARHLPLLSPPLATDMAAFAYKRVGTTASGDLTTALDGTFINEARILHCVARASGRSLRNTWDALGSSWYYLVLGDDTVLMWAKGFAKPELYVQASESLGYTSKLQHGAVFLMHLHDPATGAWTPLASRVLQQTLFNEYGGGSSALEAFAFISRTPQAFWTVNPWAAYVGRLLADTGCFREWRVHPRTAANLLRNYAFLSQVTEDAKRTPYARERFKGAASALDLSPHDLVSEAAARLLRSAEAPLPQLEPSDAADAARSLASFMAVPVAERKSRGMLRPHFTSDEAEAYYTYITTGEYEDGHDDE